MFKAAHNAGLCIRLLTRQLAGCITNIHFVQHAGGNTSRYGQSSTYLRRVTGPWNEYSLTWNTQPTSTTEHQIAVPAPTSGTDSLVQDVLPLVKDILNSEEGNHGFERVQMSQLAKS